MDYVELIINLTCMALLFTFFPSGRPEPPTYRPQLDLTPHSPLSPEAASPHSATFEKISINTLGVPTITLTPDRPPSEANHRRRHKRKSVSFSLSSLKEIIPDRADEVSEKPKKRPPTPFVSALFSPLRSANPAPAPSTPGTPLSQSLDFVDPMGVQKKWLMA